MRPVDPVERHLFLEGVFLRYGYDFRQYSEASINRRLGSLQDKHGDECLLDTLKRVLRSPDSFREVLPLLTVGTTEFFRDPQFFRALREKVFPVLRTYPTFKIWIAGCSTGEEILSLCIALKEEGLLDRAIIHATDINPLALRRARDGIYDLASVETFTRNYVAAGGTQSPSEYYTSDYRLVSFHEHNLVTDAVFTEAHLILCRNVLIYFNRELQNRALNLFSQSLAYRGFLAIGSKESLRFSEVQSFFTPVDAAQNIHQQRPFDAAEGAP